MDLITKYRPQLFKDVVGQDTATRSLEAVLRDKSAHQFCFTGPSGVGKTTLARIVASMVGCLPGQITEIDGATHTGVDDMRTVCASTDYPGMGDSPMVAIILDEAHRLSKQAWEASLKSIEEPPDYAYWFICTTQPSKIPPTILTRCVRYDLKPVPRQDIYELLGRVCDSEKLNTSDDVLWFLAGKAEGSPRQALAFLAPCVDAKTVDEAADIISTVGDESTGVIELCRSLLEGRSNWEATMKLVAPLRDMGGEGARRVIADYLTKVLMNAKSDKEAARILRIVDPFNEPFEAWDSLTPLVVAIGRAFYAGGE